MPIYSFSQIGVYQQCPMKYRYKYIDHLPDEFITGVDAILGNIVHQTLEYLYNQINNFKTPDYDSLVCYYKNIWNQKIDEIKSKGEELEIKKHGLELNDYINRGEIYIDQYYHKYFPFQDIKLIGAEESIVFDIGDGIKFKGVVDRLDKNGEVFVINDYKTQSSLPSEQKTAHTEQLTLYGIGIKQKYGKYFSKIIARLHYLHFEITDEWEITDEVLLPIVEKYKGLVTDIENKKLDYEKGNIRSFETNKSQLCNYCAFQSICPLFIHYNMDDEVVDQLSDKTIRSLIDDYGDICEKIKDLEKQKKSLKEILEKYINSKSVQIKELAGNNYRILLKYMENYKINDDIKLHQVLTEKGVIEKTLDIDKTKVKSLILNGELTLEELSDSFIKNNSITFVSYKK